MPICHVDGAVAVAADSGHRFGRHFHDEFGIGVIDRGAQGSASGRGPVEAGPGDIITVNPGEVHDGAPIGDAGRAWRMLYLTPAVVAPLIADIAEGATDGFEFERPVLSDRRLAGQVSRLFASATDPGGAWGATAEERLLALFATLRGRPADSDAGNGRGSPPAIGRARAMIDDDPARAASLDDLAREAGMGRFQLLRGFVKATGLTPHAYLVQRRVALARRLIGERLSLAEAAVAAGFADQSHMTRAFVRAHGVTPGVYAGARR